MISSVVVVLVAGIPSVVVVSVARICVARICVARIYVARISSVVVVSVARICVARICVARICVAWIYVVRICVARIYVARAFCRCSLIDGRFEVEVWTKSGRSLDGTPVGVDGVNGVLAAGASKWRGAVRCAGSHLSRN